MLTLNIPVVPLDFHSVPDLDARITAGELNVCVWPC